MAPAKDEREAQIRALFPMVKRIARRVARLVPCSTLDDLVGEGSIGLIRAVDSFDPTRGPALEHYAGRIVAGAMLNGIRRLDPVSERVRRSIRQGERDRFSLATQRGSMPSAAEMEERHPGLRRANVHAYRYAPISLDAPLPLGESLSGDWSADPAAIVTEKLAGYYMRDALKALPSRQRRVLALHYFAGVSLHAIGRDLNISPQRVSQLHIAAIQKLRKTMGHASTG